MIPSLYKAHLDLDLEPKEKQQQQQNLGCLITLVYWAVVPLWFPEHHFNLI